MSTYPGRRLFVIEEEIEGEWLPMYPPRTTESSFFAHILASELYEEDPRKNLRIAEYIPSGKIVEK